LTRLRTVNPAPTSNTSDNAISPATRVARIRRWPPLLPRAPCLRSSWTFRWRSWWVGARPESRPANDETPRPKSSTLVSTVTGPATLRSEGLRLTSGEQAGERRDSEAEEQHAGVDGHRARDVEIGRTEADERSD